MKNNRLKTVAIIPAYNEEGSIAKVILRARKHVDRVIVCDDGSSDMTFEISRALDVRVVRHNETRGKGEAFKTLSKEVMELSPDIIVTLDGDGQHDPSEIPILLKPIETGESDLVVGSRYVDGGKMDAPFYRRLGLRVINALYGRVAGGLVKDTQSGFRAYSQKAFEFLFLCDARGYGVEGEQLVLAAKNGLRVMEVPISVKYNGLAQDSKKTPLLHGVDLMTTLFRLVVEERPLKYLSFPGIGLISLGMMLSLIFFWMFNITQSYNLPLALLTAGTLVVGLLSTIAGISLHGLKRVNEKLRSFHDRFGQK